MEPNLAVEIGKIKMKSPVMVASGTFGYGEEYEEFIDLSKLGAIVTKSITLEPREGNPPPRICETPSGMLNAIGLANVGLEAFIREKMPFLRGAKIPIIVSIAAEGIKDYLRLVQRLSEVEEVSGLELNISCPNIEKRGMEFGRDAASTHRLVKSIRRHTKLTLILKLTPNVTDIGSVARAAQDGGADAISLINSVLGMAVDIETRTPELANVTGGLTGPAIKPIALRCLWEVAGCVDLPLIGMGGIMGWKDALEFILAGARAVAIGTANFIDSGIAIEVADGLSNYMKENEIEDINALVGTLRTGRGRDI